MQPDWINHFQLTPDNPPNDGILFADLQAQDRSGHMGHALVEYAPGCILGFYPNCNTDNKGHSGNGWMEYRRSTDGGETWGGPTPLPYSKQLFEANVGRTAMCEKAILTADGTVLAFLLHCDMETNGSIWEPYFEPAIVASTDGGETWGDPYPFIEARGRVYDVLYQNGTLYVLFFANPELPGVAHLEEHPYQLYVSEDGGKQFTLRATLPFTSTMHCFYGTMTFMADGRLLAYIYDEKDEHNLKYIISTDEGHTWQTARRAFFARKLRNPQIAWYENMYFMHGRSGSFGEEKGNFILYASKDGIRWDEGTYLRMREAGLGSYSNNLSVGERFPGTKKRLLIHTSHAYKDNQTNTIMWWVDKK